MRYDDVYTMHVILIILCVSVCFKFHASIFFFVMIRRPPRSTQGGSSAASDVYRGQLLSPPAMLGIPDACS